MKDEEEFVSIKFFQLIFTSDGEIKFANEELQKVLKKNSLKNKLRMDDLFPDITLRVLIKNQHSTHLKCHQSLAESEHVEILKVKRNQTDIWEMLFTPVEKEAIGGGVNDINIDSILYFLNFIPHPIFIKNSKGVYLYSNKAFSVFFGISNKKLKGLVDKDFINNDDELQLTTSTDQNIINSGDDIEIPEYIHRHKDGKKSSLFVIKMAYGKTPENRIILGLGIDTTARKKNKKELEKTSYELENFIYKTSHDLMAPIKTLKGLINIAKLNPADFLQTVPINTFDTVLRSLEDYIKEVIDFAYNRSTIISYDKVNVRETIISSFEKANQWRRPAEIELHLDIDKNLNLVIDLERFQNVLHILLGNAIQYSKPGTQHVEVNAYQKGESIVIEIQDYGIGINDKLLPKVFDMYYRANSYSKGSGLGLYNAKETIAKLDGKIEIESEEGKGTIVKVVLPNKKKG
ncbi:MAG: ATP-binding protein [Cytophagales bacterium]